MSLNLNFTLSIFFKVTLELKLKSSLIFPIRVELEAEKKLVTSSNPKLSKQDELEHGDVWLGSVGLHSHYE